MLRNIEIVFCWFWRVLIFFYFFQYYFCCSRWWWCSFAWLSTCFLGIFFLAGTIIKVFFFSKQTKRKSFFFFLNILFFFWKSIKNFFLKKKQIINELSMPIFHQKFLWIKFFSSPLSLCHHLDFFWYFS